MKTAIPQFAKVFMDNSRERYEHEYVWLCEKFGKDRVAYQWSETLDGHIKNRTIGNYSIEIAVSRLEN